MRPLAGHRTHRTLTAMTALVGVFVLLLPKDAAARAPDPDGFAKHALSRARADYRARNFDRAAARLEEAVSACGSDGCSPLLKAAILSELGAAEFKQGKEDEVGRLFAEARALSSDVPFSHYDEPGLQRLWEKASEAKPSESPPEQTDVALDASVSARAMERTQAFQAEPQRIAHIWLGVSAALDFPVLAPVADACHLSPTTGLPANGAHTYCTDPYGTDFPSRRTPESK